MHFLGKSLRAAFTGDVARKRRSVMDRLAVIGLSLFLSAWGVTRLDAQLYWDPNGGTDWNDSTSGSASKYWNPDSAGANGSRSNWVNNSVAVFSSGTGDYPGSYSITMGSAITAAGITVDEGQITLTGTNTLTLTGGSTINTYASTSLTINSSFSASTFSKTGSGTLTLGADNSFSGTITLASGTLALASAVDITVGTLSITGNSTIDFSSGASSLSASTVTVANGVTLTITGWTNTVDYFYATTALTLGTGAQIVFAGYSGSDTKWQSYDKQITPVPEPAAFGALFMGLATGCYLLRRRRR